MKIIITILKDNLYLFIFLIIIISYLIRYLSVSVFVEYMFCKVEFWTGILLFLFIAEKLAFYVILYTMYMFIDYNNDIIVKSILSGFNCDM